MRKFFVQNIFFLVIVNLIIKPVWIFAIDLKVQNTVGYATYGQYVALLNFSLIFQILLDFGLQSYNAHVIGKHPHKFDRLFPNMIFAKLIMSVGYIALILLLGWTVGFKARQMGLLFALSFVQILNSFVLYLRSNVSGMQYFKTDSLLSISDKLLMICICSVLLYNHNIASNFKIEWFVWAQIIAYFITAIIAFSLCIRFATINWHHFEFRRIIHICKQSLPFALTIFFTAIYIRSSPFLLERIIPNGAHETGIYAAAFRLLDAANNFSGLLFAGLLLPLFSKLLARKEDISPIITTSINLLIPVAITVISIVYFYSYDIMKLQHHNAMVYDSKVFTVLMFTYPAYCCYYIYSTLLVANGNIRTLVFISLIGVFVSVISNLIMIPKYHALGAAITDCITINIIAIINIGVVLKKTSLNMNYKWVASLMGFAILIISVVYLMHNSHLGLFITCACVAISAILGIFIFRLFSFKNIISILRNIKE